MSPQDEAKQRYEQGKERTASIAEKAKQTISGITETAREATERMVHTAQSSIDSIMGKAGEAKKEIATPSNPAPFKAAQREQVEAVQRGKVAVSFDPNDPSRDTIYPAEGAYSKSAPDATAAGSGGITGALSSMAHKMSETVSSAAERVGSMVGIGQGSSPSGAPSDRAASDLPAHAQMEAARAKGMADEAGHASRQAAQAVSEREAELAQQAQRRGLGICEDIRSASQTGQSKMTEKAEAGKERLSELSQETKEKASDMAQGIKERAAHVYEQSKESLGAAGDKAFQKAAEAKEAASEKGHEARVSAGTKIENVGKKIKGASQ